MTSAEIDISSIPLPADPNVAKYTDVAYWLAVCEQRVARLRLDQSAPRRVLDIGTGCGYFPFVCRGHGHDVVALDCAARQQFFRDVTAAIGVAIIEHDVAPLIPLPPLGMFDVITAYMVTFNGHETAALWDVVEWSYFLDDLAQRLAPDGVIAMELNREPNGECFTPALRELFLERGAEIDDYHVTIRSTP